MQRKVVIWYEDAIRPRSGQMAASVLFMGIQGSAPQGWQIFRGMAPLYITCMGSYCEEAHTLPAQMGRPLRPLLE